jgi:hypothetical protein
MLARLLLWMWNMNALNAMIPPPIIS